ncbi:MAG TPA: 30S ribosomal protein S8 [Caldisericia bacterium]|jgi:small subunit ribosomal protein S8|nr:30S ribosomal protein S8 [Caldisericia bacterium]HXK52352.1 30S ribosomal protein S8 [Caldisericia bacterium]
MLAVDQLSDFICRVKNANTIFEPSVETYSSRTISSIVQILKDEGFIRDFNVFDENGRKKIKIYLKYTSDRERILTDIVRISKSGRRIYSPCDKIRKVKRGMGLAIISSSKGIMTDKEARKIRVGGEVLCHIW